MENQNEKTVPFKVRIFVGASYDAVIQVPEGSTFEEAFEIAQTQLPDIPLGALNYVPDSDELDRESCILLNPNMD